MKYHKGECEICIHSKSKPLDSTTFICFADTGRKWGDCDVVTKRVVAKRKCRYFEKEGSKEAKQ